MNANLRFPNIQGKSDAEQLAQIRTYLYQLVQDLTFAFSTVAEDPEKKAPDTVATQQSIAASTREALDTFDSIKALIIKSADIAEAYGEKITKTLEGKYVAVSDFGTYTEDQLVQMEISPDLLKATVESVGTIQGRQDSDRELVRQEISEVSQRADSVAIRVGKVESDGVSKVTTAAGYTFNENGLKISKEGQPITNLLNNEGMYVKYGGANMLVADKNGVMAKDVTTKNYLIVGEHARFEDYTDGSDANRTACFWI